MALACDFQAISDPKSTTTTTMAEKVQSWKGEIIVQAKSICKKAKQMEREYTRHEITEFCIDMESRFSENQRQKFTVTKTTYKCVNIQHCSQTINQQPHWKQK